MSTKSKRASLPTSGNVAALKKSLEAAPSTRDDAPKGAELKAGWLKRGGTGALSAMFTRRYVVLHTDPALAFFEDEARLKPKGTWHLTAGTRVSPGSATDASIESGDGDGKSRCLRLRGMDAADASAWWLAMQEAVLQEASMQECLAVVAEAPAITPAPLAPPEDSWKDSWKDSWRSDDSLDERLQRGLGGVVPPAGPMRQGSEIGFQVAVSQNATRNVSALQRARAHTPPLLQRPATPEALAQELPEPPPPGPIRMASTGQLMGGVELGGSEIGSDRLPSTSLLGDCNLGAEASDEAASDSDLEDIDAESTDEEEEAAPALAPAPATASAIAPAAAASAAAAPSPSVAVASVTPSGNFRVEFSRSADGGCTVRLHSLLSDRHRKGDSDASIAAPTPSLPSAPAPAQAPALALAPAPLPPPAPQLPPQADSTSPPSPQGACRAVVSRSSDGVCAVRLFTPQPVSSASQSQPKPEQQLKVATNIRRLDNGHWLVSVQLPPAMVPSC